MSATQSAQADVLERVIDLLCRMNEAPGTHIREPWKVEIREAIVALRTMDEPANVKLTCREAVRLSGS